MELYRTNNGFICQILIGHDFDPIVVEYVQHLRMVMLFQVTPELTHFLDNLPPEPKFQQEKMILGFQRYHLLLSAAEKEIEKEDGWLVEKIFLDEFNNQQKND